jgi:cell division protein FtsL
MRTARADVEDVLRRAREEESALREADTRARITSRQARKVSSFETPVLRSNRKATHRRVSTFNIILVLFAIAVTIVLYISNIIAVNHLAADIGHLENQYAQIVNAQAVLQADISKKSGMERIGRIAAEKLGMHFPEGKTRWIAPDPDRLEQVTTP